MDETPLTIRIHSDSNQDMDWTVKPNEVTFLQTLEVLTNIMPHLTHTAFEYEDEDGDRITVRSDEEIKDMLNSYFGGMSIEDRERGLFPPLFIFPKHGKTPQNRNIHGLKINTGNQKDEQKNTENATFGVQQKQPAIMKHEGGFESILSCGKISKDSLRYISAIGQGNGGRVFRVIHDPSQKVMAAKEIVLDISVAIQKQIISELEILYKCNSRMIISFYGAFFHENKICICTEFMDGCALDNYIPVPERVLGQISLCVMEGMFYMWDLKILHRDIKPSNILVNHVGEVKLCDFGVSTQLVKSIATTFLGTNAYMAPERIQGKDYSTPAEVWSFGVTLFELATGKLPFHTRGLTQREQSISPDDLVESLNSSSDKSKPLQPFIVMKTIIEEPLLKLPPESFSPELIDFIEKCLHRNPGLRLAGQNLINHPFIHGQKGLDPSIIAEMVASKHISLPS